MTRLIFTAAVTLASLAFGPQPAAAYEAPWCAVINTGLDVHWDCQYQSIEQCYPAVLAGNRGFCNRNPYFVAATTERRAAKKRRPQQ